VSFPRYPKYRASGVDGLAAVPAHWDVTTIKRFSTLQRGHDLTDLERTDGPYPVVTSGGVVGSHGAFVAKGPGVVTGRYGSTGRLFYIDEDFWPHNTALYVNDFHGNLPRFVWYALQCVDFAAHSAKAAVPGIDRNDIHGLPAVAPPLTEQGVIAAFLDRETAKIEALVTEQQLLIDLLKEKRQAVISHAVTKGLNPNAKMKPSGIEWIGDVPAHWDVVAIKWISPVKRGASPRPIDDPIYFDDEGDYAWVRIADVSASDTGRLSATSQRLSNLGSSLSVQLEPGSLFVSIAGTVGKPCITEIKACIHDGFVYFPALNIDPRFLFRVFEAGICYGGLGKLGTQLNLNTDTIGSIRIAVPPSEETRMIGAFIDREVEVIEGLVTNIVHAIRLLHERRTALISAAVTGQIDVRNLVPQTA